MPLATLHALPHVPQFDRLVRTSVSQPSATPPEQSPKPALQAAMPQLPAEQLGVPLATVHALPHAPQCDVLVRTLVSQPSATPPAQSPKPALQEAMPQPPEEQLGVPLATLHALPHVPQLAGSVAPFTSHPSARLEELQFR